MTEETSNAPSTKQLVIGGGIAVTVAAAILVFVVLPAEFGIDLTGSGKNSGLSDLAAAGEMTELERGALREGVINLTDEAMRTDSWEFELAPYEAIEYKYTLAQGATMVFSWKGTGPLNYDMHAHPFEGGEALTESFGVGEATEIKGGYVAPFSGIHGWYWQNRTMDNVTVTLNATGAFTSSILFEGPVQQERPIAPME